MDFIKKENKNDIQFSNIKCHRTPNALNYDIIKNHISSKTNNVSYINLYERKERKELEEAEIKEKIKQNKTYFDDSLIFNLSKNNFYIINNKDDNNNNNEKEILDFLEKELNSNDSEDFNYIISNHFSTFFDNINYRNFKSSFKKEKEEKKVENEFNTNDIQEMNNTNEETLKINY